ncbi:hypothetical protein FCE95_13945 [Luteimonas gilva]|jgi:hypothetical protein|uniref:Uncharacterized protein n=1 Tax=Luteimonas gilva TaxID=2572684 RepID=A0A4V6XUR3_9GAMM|nr:hypothetical protein [Luteimonas gilva]TKR29263.1 hypothetical protein FCE95_13945 [Luteimonas gilva]
MSSIAPDPSLNRTGLDSLAGSVSLDDLRRQQGLEAPQTETAEPAAASVDTASTVDAGETLLNAPAWDGVAPGDRLLAGDMAFENGLGALDLGAAADQGVDAVIAAFA